VQCPTTTITHPSTLTNVNSEPAYSGPTTLALGAQGYEQPTANVNGAIKCQQISGGDGYSTMADGTQTFMFSFGPLSGLADIAAGLPGTEFPNVFNTVFGGTLLPGDPAATDGASGGASYGQGSVGTFTFNGAVGLIGDPNAAPYPTPSGVTATGVAVETGGVIDGVTITNPGSGYFGPVTVTFTGGFPTGCSSANCQAAFGNATTANGKITGVDVTFAGIGYTSTPTVTFSSPTTACTLSTNTACLDGHVDPRQIMDVGVMNGNIPAPLIAFDEDDEFFLTLTNVGMIMRPDLFEQHTVHFHGYPNASSFYDGVPDASVAINIGGSFTYYYLAPDAGTYFWHCHITPPEHLQMGMVGQLYVRPRQDRLPSGTSLFAGLQEQQNDLRTGCNPAADILCSATLPAVNTGASQGNDKLGNPQKYTYNDGDGSTAYDVEYPIQMHGFDPNFHFVGMTFNPEMFVDMKDKYFLLNGRSYPDTVGLTGGQKTYTTAPGPQATQSSDGRMHYSQPLPAVINIPVGGKALLRLVNLSVSEYHTLQTLGVPMKVVGWNAKLLRDQEGNNTEYYTNSITLGGGESLDAILDASDSTTFKAGQVYYLYSSNLDHLSNDAENFGGMMTEVHICNSVSSPTFGNTCN
jgi:FtsP/CotA-like multicopper oxidase with cupredoxin domain